MRELSVSSFLKDWDLPSPEGGGNYLAPCYEQLIGASYSLYRAEQNFVTDKDYDPKGLSDSLSKIATGRSFDETNWKKWLWGFYFNAGLHRIVWANDRLLLNFVNFPPTNGEPNRILGFNEVKQEARKQLSSLHQRLDGIEKALDCLTPVKQEDFAYTEVAENNLLTIIRLRVNVQKHAQRGLTWPDSFIGEGERPVKGWWGGLRQDELFEWTIKALKIVTNLYKDVHYFYVQGTYRSANF